jgi:hypothetical protein
MIWLAFAFIFIANAQTPTPVPILTAEQLEALNRVVNATRAFLLFVFLFCSHPPFSKCAMADVLA